MSEDLSIVIVDDMQFSRAVLKSALKRSGYDDVRLAASATETLKMLRERGADVVVADWVMPEMNGLELTDAIRAMDEEKSRYTSVILFTAKEGEDAMLEAFHRGVDDYLTKPVNDKELAARVFAAGRIAGMQNDLLQTTSALQALSNNLESINAVDVLTGVGNRRFLARQLDSLLLHVHSRGGGLCYAVVDIDDFQRVNRDYSYDAGDEVLRALARRLRRAVRPLDIVGRLEADTFGLILRYENPAHFRPGIFERIREAVRNRPFRVDGGEVEIDISMGAVCFNSGDELLTVPELMEQAEVNLQRARSRGAGQLEIG
ncbi:MAG: diguanylate cyclase [Gammaproteobacteria bacterium]|nr:MAG: diguanylate cyclase [Gammaproteobacteria bacterium]